MPEYGDEEILAKPKEEEPHDRYDFDNKYVEEWKATKRRGRPRQFPPKDVVQAFHYFKEKNEPLPECL